jgi:hypothetical protein
LEKLSNWNHKKTAKAKDELEELYKRISKMEKNMLKYSKDKIQIAEKLYNFIHEPTEKLDRELLDKGR